MDFRLQYRDQLARSVFFENDRPIHRAQTLEHGNPIFQPVNRPFWSFSEPPNAVIRVHSNNQKVAKGPALAENLDVTGVENIENAIGKHQALSAPELQRIRQFHSASLSPSPRRSHDSALGTYTLDVLSAKNLGKRLGSRWLFRNLEFELGIGDALLITGPNGSGKSTLLRCLCGLESLSEGSVTSGPLGLAAIDQAVYPDLTCQEHIDLMVDLRGTGDRNALDLVNLKYAANLPAQKLSSGMRARLKLAMAVLHAPTVLLLDEPSATLDAPGIELVENLIAEQLKRGCLIIATNDPNERRLANQEISLEV